MTSWTWLDRAQWFCVALECMLKSPRWVASAAFDAAMAEVRKGEG